MAAILQRRGWRVNLLVVDFLLTGKSYTVAGAQNDYITIANVTQPAEIYGEGGDDYISGGMGNDFIVGGLGSDSINASGGDNVVYGDNAPAIPADRNPQDSAAGGNDVLSGLGGNDVFYGGGGDDQVNAGGGNDYVHGGMDDTLGGAGGDDRLYGGPGHDVLGGGEGHDLLSGGEGNDRLIGNSGNDVLLAGNGADDIDGGDGSDLLVGGITTNENSSFTSVPSTTTFGRPSYSNVSDNDAALLTLLNQWSSTSSILGSPIVSHDGQNDDLVGGTGDDDFCWESFDDRRGTSHDPLRLRRLRHGRRRANRPHINPADRCLQETKIELRLRTWRQWGQYHLQANQPQLQFFAISRITREPFRLTSQRESVDRGTI